MEYSETRKITEASVAGYLIGGSLRLGYLTSYRRLHFYKDYKLVDSLDHAYPQFSLPTHSIRSHVVFPDHSSSLVMMSMFLLENSIIILLFI